MPARHPSSAPILTEFPGPLNDPARQAETCQAYLTGQEQAIHQRHQLGAGGLNVARARAAMFDRLLEALHANIPAATPESAIVAIGAYGRAALNPQTAVRFLLLVAAADAGAGPSIESFAASLAALDLDPSQPAATPDTCIAAARSDFGFATALLDARFVAGSTTLFQQLTDLVSTTLIGSDPDGFAARCQRRLHSRHHRYSDTVFLQEPNVKESCGGLDDYHSMRWICRLQPGSNDLESPAGEDVLTESARQEIHTAVDFLHRIRNELHYHTGAPTDRLTLMLQGVVAETFEYPQRDILRRTEALMRDYYRHTLALYQHTRLIVEHCRPGRQPGPDQPAGEASERFDGFVARGGLLEPAMETPFAADPNRLMRAFLHCQIRRLTPSPALCQLIAARLPHLDRSFRHSKANRETFQAILERKGEVASILRLMHGNGVLGRYLPEFGALDGLVQHEFFHRYTADEHTLRCTEELDHLITENRPDREIFRRLLHEITDPFALYLAAILHDTGRAENASEHIDGSTVLAAKLCHRLQIQGPRRSLIMFLVGNHLTLWRTATTCNLEDPEVIAEFAAVVKTVPQLDALLLFTFADSNATSPDAWNGWKQSLILQLHAATRRFIEGGGRETYASQLESDLRALHDEVIALLRPEYHEHIDRHFALMPAAAFHYREARQIAVQIRTVRHFLKAARSRPSSAPPSIKWLDYPRRGYTELILATHDRPLLLEQLCCALAACQINILSADFFTRTDHVVVDVFRVCTADFEIVADPALREGFLDCFKTILKAEQHDPKRYLHHLSAGSGTGSGPDIPTRAAVSNHLHPNCTTVEIQAVDRIGILHDLFLTINQHGLTTAHARICTEKGVATDTLYITTQNGGKVTDLDLLERLGRQLSVLAGAPEQTG
ncbi:MAG: hypothetical protein K9N23_12270 [Akkermansiaceae bacterium]|nr:hypothetical protein [Akkermansiaceae bacterium]